MQARKFLKRAIDIIMRPYMRILPGQLAFFWLMSLIPLVVVVGSIANYFSLSLDSLDTVSSTLPFDVGYLFSSSSITDGGLNFSIIIFFLSSFLLASNGMHSVIVTSSEIYGYPDEGILDRRLKSIAMTLVLVLMLLFLLIFIVFGNSILEIYNNSATLGSFASFLLKIFEYLKLPLTLVFVYFNIRVLYRMGPTDKIKNKASSLAALFTTAIWAVGTEIYAIYFKFFADYNLFYGSVSNILILMIWLYFLAYTFVVGMTISGNLSESL